MHFSHLVAAVAGAATLVAANPVDKRDSRVHGRVAFRRFASENCPQESKIDKKVEIKVNECKEFAAKEPGFRSFSAEIINLGGHHHKFDKEKCHFLIYQEMGCKGEGWRALPVADTDGDCMNFDNNGGNGRSVFLNCKGDGAQPENWDWDDDSTDDGLRHLQLNDGPGGRPKATSKHGKGTKVNNETKADKKTKTKNKGWNDGAAPTTTVDWDARSQEIEFPTHFWSASKQTTSMQENRLSIHNNIAVETTVLAAGASATHHTFQATQTVTTVVSLPTIAAPVVVVTSTSIAA